MPRTEVLPAERESLSDAEHDALRLLARMLVRAFLADQHPDTLPTRQEPPDAPPAML